MSKNFIPSEIQCFWCNGRMERGTTFSSTSINHVSYFCKDCGAVSHFAVNNIRHIDSISVEYFTKEPPEEVKQDE